MEDFICKVCGSPKFKKINETEYQCECCGKRIVVNNNSEEYINLINAFHMLRMGKFTDAEDTFIDIKNKNEKCYEAYWGELLAHYGIIIEYKDGKRYPTLYDYMPRSFLEEDLYKKFLKYVPENEKDVYISLAEQIETLRIKVYKQYKDNEEYDIFIAFKKTDEEGKNTPDYTETLKLYAHLIKNGYNVFFSPETLVDKAGEEYEPIIYHALRTAKVLIVYGQKREFFESTWVKNEWGRFLKMKENGEKQKNSLIVCIENMDPYDLPKALKGKQAIDFTSNKGAYGTIDDIINKIIDISNHEKLIKKAIIHKTSKINEEKVKRNLNLNKFSNKNTIEIKESENRSLDVAYDSLQSKDFKFAEDRYLQIYNNKQYKQKDKALLGYMLSKNKVLSLKDFLKDINLINLNIETICKILDYSDEEDALNNFIYPIYNLLEISVKEEKDINIIYNIYSHIIEYNHRDSLSINVLDYSIKKVNYNLFKIAIVNLDNVDVHKIINYFITMQNELIKTNRFEEAKELIESTLEINEGNIESLYNKLLCTIGTNKDIKVFNEKFFISFHKILEYSDNPNFYIIKLYEKINEYKVEKGIDKVYLELVSRIQEDNLLICKYLLEIANRLKENRLFKEAIRLYQYYLNETKSNKYLGYEGILLCNYKCKNENELKKQKNIFSNSNEYINLLTNSFYENKEVYDKYKKIRNEHSTIQKDIRKKRVKKFKIAFVIICIFIFIICCLLNPNNGTWKAERLEKGKEVEISRYVLGIKFETVKLKAFDETYKLINEKNSTCNKKGYKEYKIVYDKIKYTFKLDIPIDDENHNYSEWVIKDIPTEDENGIIERKCLNNKKHKETKEILPLSSDEYTKEVLKVATCTKKGLCKYTFYYDNQEITFEADIPIDDENHNYSEWVVTNVPTENVKGIIERKCLTSRKHKETREISPLSSNEYTKEVLKVATCINKGLCKYTFNYNNQVITFEADIPIDDKNHNYSEWIVTNIPTENETGLIQKTCLNDGNHMETIEIPELYSSLYESKVLKEATCTKKGLCEYTIYYDNQKINFRTEINKISHNYTKYEIIETPTKNSSGAALKYCGDCDKDEYVELPILDNINYEIITERKVSCTVDGIDNYIYTSGDLHIEIATTIEHTGHTLKGYSCTKCSTVVDYIYENGYIYIGEYPQTIKDERVSILNMIENTNYYLGSDGERYVKKKANQYETPCIFSNNVIVVKNSDYYFKVEPVKWKILSYDDGEYLLFSEVILNAHKFDSSSTDYYNSELKDYLNGDMLNVMFTKTQLNIIQSSDLGKLFLLSKDEITNKAYGFTNDTYETKKRYKKVTDYAIANWIKYEISSYNDSYIGNGWYWLRTAYDYEDSKRAYSVSTSGSISFYYDITNDCFGIVPAMRIKLS